VPGPRSGRSTYGLACLFRAGSLIIVAECVFYAPAVDLVAAMDALGVDAEQDINAVAGPFGDLGGVDAGVQPGGQAGGGQP
jgi:hypothetical protein